MIISYICARTVSEIRDFTLQVIQNPLIFTTNGFFDLDYTLMRNVLGTITTFLIILIQVGNVVRPVLIENSTLSTNNYTDN
ncbi:putative gustatory receptor 28b [Vespula maculifrons]|uniref:Gustatory receptor 28b n=1 Tax=Vespula maculifrons TaxID=7453 RepID=A0ABD2CRK0_VESMC